MEPAAPAEAAAEINLEDMMEPAALAEAAAEIVPEEMMEPAAPAEPAAEIIPDDMMEPAAPAEAAAESVEPVSVEAAPAPAAAQPVSEPIDDPQAEIVTERISELSEIEPVEAEIVAPAAPIPAESLPEPAAASAEMTSAQLSSAEIPNTQAPAGLEGSLSAAMGAVAAAVHAAGAEDSDQAGVGHALETQASPNAPAEEASAFDELAQGGAGEDVGATMDDLPEDIAEPVVARMETGTIPHAPVPSFLRGVDTESPAEDADGAGGIFGSGNADLRLEAIVRDALKPRLKEWLDEHLSELVEQMIREEVQSMVGKKRSAG
ncbi:MAG TPA: DUF2497 domain-containing protein [Alphaproteobacteria bacterium]|nr:DUF2497 domain-containing protein [Alphaproteobacteria bacterium]